MATPKKAPRRTIASTVVTVVVIIIVAIIKSRTPDETTPSANSDASRPATEQSQSRSLQEQALPTKSRGSSGSATAVKAVATEAGDEVIERAFRNKQSDVMVESAGIVVKSLPDDLEGSRHQRFILRLQTGRSLLVAHNIDLAPRVPLQEGDRIEFKGEYEWNDRGGVVHWTHHDPRKRHPGGWLRLDGRTYE